MELNQVVVDELKKLGIYDMVMQHWQGISSKVTVNATPLEIFVIGYLRAIDDTIKKMGEIL